MTQNIIIGLCGAKGSGKTSSVSILRELISSRVNEFYFSRPLKEICSSVFNLPIEIFEIPQFKEVELIPPIVLEKSHLDQILNHYNLSNYINNIDYSKYINVKITTPRKLLQFIGTDFLRFLDEDIHCKQVIKYIKPGINVCTDIRFLNEMNFLKSLTNYKFYLFYIFRKISEKAAKKDGHSSEQNLSKLKKLSIIVDSNSDLLALKEEWKKHVNKIFKGEIS